jgi:hypothetical protein
MYLYAISAGGIMERLIKKDAIETYLGLYDIGNLTQSDLVNTIAKAQLVKTDDEWERWVEWESSVARFGDEQDIFENGDYIIIPVGLWLERKQRIGLKEHNDAMNILCDPTCQLYDGRMCDCKDICERRRRWLKEAIL